jgi:peptide chain release factor subunit 1
MADSLTRSRLRRLADLRPQRGRVLSVYLNLDPSELPTPPARASAISSLINDAQRKVDELSDLPHDDRMALRADVEHVREVLAQPDIANAGTRAIAVFACAPAGVLETVRLAHRVEPRVVVDGSPYLEPLVREGTDERWCVLLCNRRAARVFLGTPEALEETDRVEDDVHSHHHQGGWSQARYQRSVEEEVRDHLDHVAHVVFDVFKRWGIDHLLIGAPEETRGDLERLLHPYLRERLGGRVHVDIEHATLDEVRAETAKAVREIERRREADALERFRQGVGSGGRAAAGIDEVLAALNEARVGTLLLGAGFASSGYVDPATGLLAGPGGSGPVSGGALEAVDDIVERAVEKALESSAHVLVVRHHDDLALHGGIGALLRY